MSRSSGDDGVLEDGECADSHSQKAVNYGRFNRHQLNHLEEVFQRDSHPDTEMQKVLGEELGMKPSRIRYWFQNRRNKEKTRAEHRENSELKAENGRLREDNAALHGALHDAQRNTFCPTCMVLENLHLKNELAEWQAHGVYSWGVTNPVYPAQMYVQGSDEFSDSQCEPTRRPENHGTDN